MVSLPVHSMLACAVSCCRVFGDQLAEMPFVATRQGFRRAGHCRRLIKVRAECCCEEFDPSIWMHWSRHAVALSIKSSRPPQMFASLSEHDMTTVILNPYLLKAPRCRSFRAA